jgi:DNA-binding GntR family transcriptional regulator
MNRYDVALATVTKALSVLSDAGLAETIQGKGTFARKPPPPGPSGYDLVMERLDDIDERLRRLEELNAGAQGKKP